MTVTCLMFAQARICVSGVEEGEWVLHGVGQALSAGGEDDDRLIAERQRTAAKARAAEEAQVSCLAMLYTSVLYSFRSHAWLALRLCLLSSECVVNER